MNTMSILYYLALADFFERARRYSFLLILAAAIYLGVLVNNGTMGMDLGSNEHNILIRYHGELNSAWVGTMTVMVTNLFLGLFGFYLVSDCIKRDIRTGVGQIIATTPVSRAAYLVGKWISNFVVLAVLVLILAIAAVVMVLLQSETALDLAALLMPFLAVALPYMALTAALAVFFETIPWLRGAVGNLVYAGRWATWSTFSCGFSQSWPGCQLVRCYPPTTTRSVPTSLAHPCMRAQAQLFPMNRSTRSSALGATTCPELNSRFSTGLV